MPPGDLPSIQITLGQLYGGSSVKMGFPGLAFNMCVNTLVRLGYEAFESDLEQFQKALAAYEEKTDAGQTSPGCPMTDPADTPKRPGGSGEANQEPISSTTTQKSETTPPSTESEDGDPEALNVALSPELLQPQTDNARLTSEAMHLNNEVAELRADLRQVTEELKAERLRCVTDHSRLISEATHLNNEIAQLNRDLDRVTNERDDSQQKVRDQDLQLSKIMQGARDVEVNLRLASAKVQNTLSWMNVGRTANYEPTVRSGLLHIQACMKNATESAKDMK